METNDKVYDLLRKLHALAQRGVGGEKDNAENALQRLMRRHKVTLENITEERKDRRLFEYTTKEHQTFILQVIASITGVGIYRAARGVRRKMWVDLTTAEHLEAVMKIDHYWPMFKEEQALFYAAFIQANALYCKNSEESMRRLEDMTEEERRHSRRIAEMMRGIRTDTPTKRLERAEKLTA